MNLRISNVTRFSAAGNAILRNKSPKLYPGFLQEYEYQLYHDIFLPGIVDKSVELLADGKDSLTLNRIFDLIDRVKPRSWEADQIDDNEYCKNKLPTGL